MKLLLDLVILTALTNRKNASRITNRAITAAALLKIAFDVAIYVFIGGS